MLFVFAGRVSASDVYEESVERVRLNAIYTWGIEVPKELGPKDAPITFDIFADFSEPFSKKFFRETFDTLVARYPQIRFRFMHRNLQYRGETALQMGILTECLSLQEKLWINIPILINLESASMTETLLDVNQEKLHTCVNSTATRNAVNFANTQATQMGINASPVFLLRNNDRPNDPVLRVIGAKEIAIFDQAIAESTNGKDGEYKKIEEKLTQLEQKVAQTGQRVSTLQQMLDAIMLRLRQFFGI